LSEAVAVAVALMVTDQVAVVQVVTEQALMTLQHNHTLL
jgi:hypothetical protein